MIEIYLKDIKEIDYFKKFDDDFFKVYSDDENHIYVFKRIREKQVKSYEVVKGVKHKNPDGSIIYRYPTSEEFGTYGYYIFGTEDYCKQRINYRIEGFKKEK